MDDILLVWMDYQALLLMKRWQMSYLTAFNQQDMYHKLCLPQQKTLPFAKVLVSVKLQA